MMLGFDKVGRAIKEQGMSAVCAWCLKYWRAREHDGANSSSWVCQSTRPCGGPMQGMAFPEYEGPMKGRLASFCYICGGVPEAAVDIGGKGMVGVCNKKGRAGKTCMELLRDQLGNPRVVRSFEEKTVSMLDHGIERGKVTVK